MKEKEEETKQMKEGLKAALEEMTKLKLLLQVQRLLQAWRRAAPGCLSLWLLSQLKIYLFVRT